ncbi:oxidoreductase CipA-like protein [Lasiosphaeria ovina]|uniref:Oxidoreductase CipA-like protein n=1 Tax=Lasiosphaeria ovina TaxID=92902 RepID=A0AAE0NM56_9PEZI|nr:oxidoreductase CipA-like protein [Lasiosphaeria ovina]
MAPGPRIALAGATGGLGPTVVAEFVANGLHVTLLTRKGGSGAKGSTTSELLDIKEVDYENIAEVTKALHGVDVFISTVGNPGLDAQIQLIDAAVAAGVKRFLPSEFGAEAEHPRQKDFPLYVTKRRIVDYLAKKAAEHPSFSYTRVVTHAFFDWGISESFLVDRAAHHMVRYNGGNTPFSVTTLKTIATALVFISKNLEATKNRAVFVHDAAITQNQLARLAQEADGIEWTFEEQSTKQLLQDSLDELRKLKPDVGKAMRGFTTVAVYDADHDPDLTGRVDNEMMGIPIMGDREVADVIKKAMAKV